VDTDATSVLLALRDFPSGRTQLVETAGGFDGGSDPSPCALW
jgi:hypothetical protein